MNFKVAFVCMFIFGTGCLVKSNEYIADKSPYYVGVGNLEGSRLCGGILITENYVITLANCVDGLKEALIFLGFNHNPHYEFSKQEHTQIIYSSNIIIYDNNCTHERTNKLINIALVKLEIPAPLSDYVRPGKLFNQDPHLIEGHFGVINGWSANKYESKKNDFALLLPKKTCNSLLGGRFVESEVLCIKGAYSVEQHIRGNPIEIIGGIIGLSADKGTGCSKNNHMQCNELRVVINFLPFLKWISEKLNMPIEKFTSYDYELGNNYHDLAKIKVVKNSHTKAIPIFGLYGDEITNINIKIQEILADIEKTKKEEKKCVMTTELISNIQIKMNENIRKLQKDYESMKIMLKVGLNKQQSLEDELRDKNEELCSKQKIDLDVRINKEDTTIDSLWSEIKYINVTLNKVLSIIYD